MGANAQTSVPAFTAGQVLTAQQQTEINTGIPVFATTTTRDAAFGGTGEKVLAEGQMAYIENIAGSSAVQYYDGAAWATLVTSGLTLIKTQVVGSAVSSVQVTGAFSATYDNYIISYNDGTSTATNNMNLLLGATTSGYYTTVFGTSWNNVFDAVGNTNNTKFERIGDMNSSTGSNIFCFVQSPFLAKRTRVQASYMTLTGSFTFNGMLNNTTSYTDFTITPESGTITGGTIRVYGYQNS